MVCLKVVAYEEEVFRRAFVKGYKEVAGRLGTARDTSHHVPLLISNHMGFRVVLYAFINILLIVST
jgi:hypothetical protein